MISGLRSLLWNLRLALVSPDKATARLLRENGIIADRVAHGQVYWPDDDIRTDLVRERFFLEGASHLGPLRNSGARWTRHPDGRLLLQVCEVVLAPSSAEEILIAREIFHDGVYNLIFARPAVLVDIGANVGMASLAFARHPLVEKVYAYEPIPENVTRARFNFSLNTKLETKIELQTCALGAEPRMQIINYNPRLRGSASLRALPTDIARLGECDHEELQSVQVEVKSASHSILNLPERHPDCDLWLKLDCEGAEDEIVANLISTGAIARVRGLVMETHFGNSGRLQKMLTEAGFTVWHPEPNSRDLGYLIGFRA